MVGTCCGLFLRGVAWCGVHGGGVGLWGIGSRVEGVGVQMQSARFEVYG